MPVVGFATAGEGDKYDPRKGLMNMPTPKKLAVVAFKVGLSAFAIVIAVVLAALLTVALDRSNNYAQYFSLIIIASFLLPIWYVAQIRWRLMAAVFSSAAGIGAMMFPIYLFVTTYDFVMSMVITFAQILVAISVSLIVGIRIIHYGRSRTSSGE